MNLRIYLIVEEGADRVYVCGTTYPTYYKKRARQLTVPESIARGLGPECASRAS